eukprot:scaffold4761_cov205-Amphora_coffeaeformis.AAC.4
MKISLLLPLSLPLTVVAFTLPKSGNLCSNRPPIHRLQVADSDEKLVEVCPFVKGSKKVSSPSFNLARLAASAGLGVALLFTSPSSPHTTALAYDPSDYASETVQSTIKALEDSAGNSVETYKVFEEMNSIITEGKGVGGAINYKGIQLERG